MSHNEKYNYIIVFYIIFIFVSFAVSTIGKFSFKQSKRQYIYYFGNFGRGVFIFKTIHEKILSL